MYLDACVSLKITRLFEHEYNVNHFVKLSKLKNWWVKVPPAVGDLFVQYDEKNASNSHIGFVREIKEDKIITVEGNFSNKVLSRPLSFAKITGYIRIKI